jgi:hypothetical protein
LSDELLVIGDQRAHWLELIGVELRNGCFDASATSYFLPAAAIGAKRSNVAMKDNHADTIPRQKNVPGDPCSAHGRTAAR